MLITFIIYSALISAFIILLLVKIGLIEYLQVYAPALLSKLANCNFCLSFWVNCIVSIIMFIIFKDISILVVPFLAPPITRFLI